MVAVLVRRFGAGWFDMAEDIASDTFLAAAQTWCYQGISENPDSQLRMMFAICHPTIPTESQIALSLRILYGFGIALASMKLPMPS